MTQARRDQISLPDTPYYHCINRCVRRAFLCGEDRESGRSYEHRKPWIVDRLKALSSVFSIDVCAYAVMSNHYHVVLRVKTQQAGGWGAEEVVARWKQLFNGSPLIDRYLSGQCASDAERELAEGTIAQWRERLFDISWFMRCLNEGIAREANREDGCKGRFWEGRFKSQALLDERALLACMAYVDLNPIRAGLCETLEGSDFTSIQARIMAVAEGPDGDVKVAGDSESRAAAPPPVSAAPESKDGHSSAGAPSGLGTSAPVAGFVGGSGEYTEAGLPFELADYLQLVDWTGRQWREDKHGAIPAGTPALLLRLGVDGESWSETVRHFRDGFHDHVGPAEALQRRGEALGRRWLRGIRACRRLWETPTPNAAVPLPSPGASGF